MSKDLIEGGEYKYLKARKLTEETCRKFGYRVVKRSSGMIQVADFRDRNGDIIANHIRTKDKDFPWKGDKKKATLFGQHLWPDQGRKVVITEGEIDAMTVSQIQNHKWPVVSIKSGASGAKADIKEQIDWLEKYEEVIFMFDNDEPGREAAKECAHMMSPGKAKIATLDLKDANEMLLAGRSQEVIKAIWDAKTYRPDFLIDPDELWEEMAKVIEEGYSLPWPGVSDATNGIRFSEVWTLLAGSGMGKTEVFKELAYYMATEHGLKSACIFLEDSPGKTALAIAGKHVNKRLHDPKGDWTEEEKQRGFDEVVRSGKVLIHNHEGNSDFEEILSAMKYFVVAQDCKFIFLDHITAMAEGKGSDNVNSYIHLIMEELNKFVQRYNVSIFLISHIKKSDKKPAEEGGRVTADMAYGSGAIKQRSNFIFALERDQQAERTGHIDINHFRCLKDRNLGEAAGQVFLLAYDHRTGRLTETEDDETSRGFSHAAGEDEDDDVPF